MYDLIIIGAGPAGVSAALYAQSRGLKTLILEKKEVGGMIAGVSTVTHFTGLHKGETGPEFAEGLRTQLTEAGVPIRYQNVVSVKLRGDVKKVYTATEEYEAEKIILANGTTPRRPDIKGADSMWGTWVGLNALRDGKRFTDKDVFVVGGADGAIKEALYLAKYVRKVTIIHFEDHLDCCTDFKNRISACENVDLRLLSRLVAVIGEHQLRSLTLRSEDDGSEEEIAADGCGVFIYAGSTPNTQLYTELKLSGGFIPVNEKMETEIPGVYAAGDIRVKQLRQIATAVSDGAIAAINAA